MTETDAERCRRKRWWATRRDAHKAKKALERSFPAEKFDVYRCTVCTGWHVGHMASWKRAGR